jgi:hypothetical protein
MLNQRNIINELNRRLSEVESYANANLSLSKNASNFFMAIADYFNHVQTNRKLKGYCDQLVNAQKKLSISKELEKDRDAMQGKLKPYFDDINEIITTNNVTIIPNQDIMKPGYCGSISVEQAISLTYWEVDNALKVNNSNRAYETTREIIRLADELIIKGLKNPKLDNIYKECRKAIDAYDDKMKAKIRLEAFLRHDAYVKLFELWNYVYNGRDWKKSFTFCIMYREFLDSDSFSTNLSSEGAHKLALAKEEYLPAIHKMHNYLLDKCDETNVVVDIFSQAIRSMTTTFIGLFLIGMLLILCKSINFQLPIKLINEALKYTSLVK